MHPVLVRLRDHVVTGFIFIMPVLITLAVLMKFWKDLLKIGSKCSRLLGVDTVLGPSGDALMAILFFLVICIAAGFLIRISFLKRLSERIDSRLNDWIPGYGQVRTQATRKIGAEKKQEEPSYEGCLVRVEDLWRPGYLVERNGDGTRTVFVPQAPASTTGQVYVVGAERIRELGIDSRALAARLGLLGKGLLGSTDSAGPPEPK